MKQMHALVEKFSREADQADNDKQKCFGSFKAGKESFSDLRKRCQKIEDKYDATVKDFSDDIKKLLKAVDDKKAEKKILDELGDLRKCTTIYKKCKKGCSNDDCIGHCCENADKCDDVQAKDMRKILKAME